MSEASMEITHTEYMRLRGKIETAEAALAASQAREARLMAWLTHERNLCEAAGDRAGRIAYQRVLDQAARAAMQGETP